MREYPSDIAFTPAVKNIQTAKGSRASYAKVERRGWRTRVTPDLAEFLAGLDMFYLVEDDADLLERLSDPVYPGKVERAIVFTVQAWDINCPQHIQKRFSQRQVQPVIEQLQRRISELEAQLAQRQGHAPSPSPV
jgi:hypothetical protein